MGGVTLDVATIVQALLIAALAWVGRTAVTTRADLTKELHDFKLHVAENYLKKEGLVEVKAEIKEVRDVVFSIAAKLGVTIKKPGGE